MSLGLLRMKYRFFSVVFIGLPFIVILSSGVALSPSFAGMPFRVTFPCSRSSSAFRLEQ